MIARSVIIIQKLVFTYIVSNTHNTPARNDFIDIILSFKLWILYTVISIIANHESIFLEMLHLGKFYW